jgi:hypothetical protein
MARIRSVKPDSCTDERLADCSPTARLTFTYMQCFCDDGGVHPAKPRTLKAEVFPMDDFSAAQVAEWVAELLQAGLLGEFTGPDGESYWFVRDWFTLQKIEKPSLRYPQPPEQISAINRRPVADQSSNAPRTDVAEQSSNPRRTVSDDHPAEGREGREGKGVGDSSTSRRTPKRASSAKTSMPANFGVSDRVRAWAADKGFDKLDQHLEAFRGKAAARGYAYADWDAAFQEAIREDWAGLRSGSAPRNGLRGGNPQSADIFAGMER